jgi:hypothetical protein
MQERILDLQKEAPFGLGSLRTPEKEPGGMKGTHTVN